MKKKNSTTFTIDADVKQALINLDKVYKKLEQIEKKLDSINVTAKISGNNLSAVLDRGGRIGKII